MRVNGQRFRSKPHKPDKPTLVFIALIVLFNALFALTWAFYPEIFSG